MTTTTTEQPDTTTTEQPDTTTTEQPDTTTTEQGNPMPPWWGWPGGHWRTDVPGTAGPNGFRATIGTDCLLHRGIRAGDLVWINPDKPAQPGEVVFARMPDGRELLGVWAKVDVGFRDNLQTDGPPPWGETTMLAGLQSAEGPETFTIVGPAVFVDTDRQHGPEVIPSHAPLPAAWGELRRYWNKPWTFAGETSARVEMAGVDGQPYVLSLALIGPPETGRRFYLPAKDQTRTRQLVETARRAAWADLRPLRPESRPAEAPEAD